MSDDLSVSSWLVELKAGNDAAAQPLFNRYFMRLVQLSRKQLGNMPRGVADEEDIALSAFDSFVRRAAAGKFPRLDDRNNLWSILVKLTIRKSIDLIHYENRLKRGGSDSQQGLERKPKSDLGILLCPDPSPALAAQLRDEVEFRLRQLADERLILIARLRMDAYTIEEIAAKLACTTRTVERKLFVIRSIWNAETPDERQ